MPDELSTLTERVAALERRLATLGTRRRTLPAPRQLLDTLLPKEARGHLRASGREQLRAVRVVLDRWIEGNERADEGRRRERIRVE